MTTTLYRAFDANGQLLYVGIADQPFCRLGQHSNASWTAHAATITLEQHADRESAAAAELAAIRSEDPVWNVNGRSQARHVKWMIAYPDRHADDISDAEFDEVINGAAGIVNRFRRPLLSTGGDA